MIGDTKQRESCNLSQNNEDKLTSKQVFDIKIVVLSFFCIIQVMLIHSINIGAYALNFENGNAAGVFGIIENIVVKICGSANSYFFMISAYLFYANFKSEKLKEKLTRRLKTLLIPYLIAVTISVVFYGMIKAVPGLNARLKMENYYFSFPEILRQYIDPLFNYPLWFAKNLILFSACAPLVYFIVKNKYVGTICIGILAIFDICSMLKISFINWLTVYMVGAFVGYYTKDFTRGLLHVRKSKLNLALLAVLWGGFILALLLTDSNTYIGQMVTTTYKYIAPFLIWSSFDLMIDIHRTLIFHNWWLNISFYVYCYHALVLPTVTKIIKLGCGMHSIIGFLSFWISPIITYALLVLLAVHIKKIPKAWCVLTGGRN